MRSFIGVNHLEGERDLGVRMRTRFCPIRFTYSLTTGGDQLGRRSTCWEYCLPMRISLSKGTSAQTALQSRLPIGSRRPASSFHMTWSSAEPHPGGLCGLGIRAGAAGSACLGRFGIGDRGFRPAACHPAPGRTRKGQHQQGYPRLAVNRTFMISPDLLIASSRSRSIGRPSVRNYPDLRAGEDQSIWN